MRQLPENAEPRTGAHLPVVCEDADDAPWCDDCGAPATMIVERPAHADDLTLCDRHHAVRSRASYWEDALPDDDEPTRRHITIDPIAAETRVMHERFSLMNRIPRRSR